jgi:hypothetical protein
MGSSGNIESLPLKMRETSHFECPVVDTLALCTLPEPVAVLREIARGCRPQGHIPLLEHGRSDQAWLGRWQDRRAVLFRHFPPARSRPCCPHPRGWARGERHRRQRAARVVSGVSELAVPRRIPAPLSVTRHVACMHSYRCAACTLGRACARVSVLASMPQWGVPGGRRPQGQHWRERGCA